MSQNTKKRCKNIILLVSLATLVIHFINKIIFRLSSHKNTLSADNGDYYDWRFGRIFYTRQGSGSPLLLIHDLKVHSSGYEWNELIKDLSKKHTVYTIDLLGCGRSEKPHITYSNYLYVQMVNDFIKSIIGHKTDVIATGHSCSFLTMACYNDQTLYNKLIFINPDSLYKLNRVPSKRTKSLKLLLDTPIIGTMLYNIVTSSEYLNRIFKKYYIANPGKIKANYVDAYHKAAHLEKGEGRFLLSSIKGCYTNINILRALRSINQSITIIGGSDIPDIQTIIDNYRYYNPAIEFALISNTRHLPQIEQPVSVLEQIDVFV